METSHLSGLAEILIGEETCSPVRPRLILKVNWMNVWKVVLQQTKHASAQGFRGYSGRQAIKPWLWLAVTRSAKKDQCILNSNFDMCSQPTSWLSASIPTYQLCPLPRMWFTEISGAKCVCQGHMWAKPTSKHQLSFLCTQTKKLILITITSHPESFTHKYLSHFTVGSQTQSVTSYSSSKICRFEDSNTDRTKMGGSTVSEFAVSPCHLKGYQGMGCQEGHSEPGAKGICYLCLNWQDASHSIWPPWGPLDFYTNWCIERNLGGPLHIYL